MQTALSSGSLEIRNHSNRVERDIRYAIGLAWDRDNGEAAARVFGGTVGNGRPTNSQFIAKVASKLRVGAKPG
ncbi:MAG TPA: sporulation initiation factor Spo0A C-terminal domain-containing protein [Spirochaetia bacterium]|nr:sporulation initiation factor Spo0A C-terminal domain-containing protein [Spirochaetia bacterium]